MKQRLLLILIALAALIPLPALAVDYGVGATFTYTYEGQTLTYKVLTLDSGNYTCSLYSYGTTKPTGKLIIPEIAVYPHPQYSGGYLNMKCTVVEIAENALKNCSGITDITIPNSVTSIGSSAFYGCSSLADITIPNSVTSIGDEAFYGCSSLTAITILSSVTSIGKKVFYNCSGLTDITLPNSVTSIGEYAFYGCSSLTDITLPNSVTSIGEYAFYGCSSLTDITLPNSVTSIGEYAFYNCYSLTTITIPCSVTSIKNFTFASCPNLKSIKLDGYSATPLTFVNSTFGYLGNSNKINIDLYVPLETWLVFGGAKNIFQSLITSSYFSCNIYLEQDNQIITDLIIPESMTEIKDGVFAYVNVKTVTIPATIKTIGYSAFQNCNNITDIYYKGSLEDWLELGGIDLFVVYGDEIYQETFQGANLYCNDELITDMVIPESVTEIKTTATSCIRSLKTVKIPMTVKAMEAQSFSYCSELHTVTIGDIHPDSPDMLEWGHFTSCPSLKQINIFSPNLYESEYLGAFYELAVPNRMIYVPQDALNNYRNAEYWKNADIKLIFEINPSQINLAEKKSGTLTANAGTSMDILGGTVSWTSSNSSVATVNKDGKVIAVGKGTATITASLNNEDLGLLTATCEVTVVRLTTTDNGIEYEVVFGGGKNGEDIVKVKGGNPDSNGNLTIPSEVEIDGVKYPVTSVDNGAFENNTDIKKVVIPSSVTTVGSGAFSGCTNLKEVVAESSENPIEIADNAFENAPLEKLTQGRDVEGTPFKEKETLKEVTIGEKVTTIAPGEFTGCTGIEEISFLGTTPPQIGENAFEKDVTENATVRVPDGSEGGDWGDFDKVYAESDVLAESITINPAQAEVAETRTVNLHAVIAPVNTTDMSVTWVSDNTAVATVNEHGVVTGVAKGTATITAMTVNGLTASSEVTVIILTVNIGGIDYELVVGGEGKSYLKVTGGNPDGEGNLKIPGDVEIDGVKYPVTEIEEGAFKENTGIKKVVVPETVTTIGKEAFSGCTSLTEVVTEDSENPIEIADDAFDKVPLENLYQGRDVKGQPFTEKETLTEVTIGEKVTTLEPDAFKGCTDIEEITFLGTTPPEIDENAFEKDVTENATVKVPDGSENENWGDFKDVVPLDKILPINISIDPANVEIPVTNTAELKAIITPDNATDQTVTWSSSDESVVKVDDNGNLTAVSKGSAVITVKTVNGITATCNVTVVAQTVTINGIEYEIVEGGEGSEEGSKGDSYLKVIGGNPDPDGNLTVPSEVEIKGKKYPVTEIEEGAFEGNTEIKKVVVPETVTSIGKEAFKGCTSLTEVVTEDGEDPIEIAEDAFENVPLENLYQGRDVKGKPFTEKETLTEVTIGEKVTTLEPDAFKGCTDIEDITFLGTTPPEIDENTFEKEVTENATVKVPEGSETDNWGDFKNVVEYTLSINPQSVRMGEGESIVLKAVFTPEIDSKLTVTWSSDAPEVATVDEYGNVTAISCGTATINAITDNGLTATCEIAVIAPTVTVNGIDYEVVVGGGENGEDIIRVKGGNPAPAGNLIIPSEVGIDGKKYPVTEIEEGAFEGNTEIKKVVVPETVTTIGKEAFKGCTSLTEVVTEDGEDPIEIAEDAFEDVPVENLYQGRDVKGTPFKEKETLKEVTIGENVTTLEPDEFNGCPNITDINILGNTPPEIDENTFDKEVTD
ncbi:MAG: leucine-rich repeat protein, partial [Paramuribaculum sp.]|nr:leucine-rich repeat protein [Paramuribaculum sp.]